MAVSAPTALTVLQIQLHSETVGHVVRQQSGHIAWLFDPAWVGQVDRPALTLSGTRLHPSHAQLFSRPWLRTQGLHPLLANLLPETGMRSLLTNTLQLQSEDDFSLLAALGSALPGAWQIRSLATDEIPTGVLDFNASVISLPATPPLPASLQSFAGSQRKLVIAADNVLVKFPGRPGQSRNEFSALTLARLAGVDCVNHSMAEPTAFAELALPPLHIDEPLLVVERFDLTAEGEAIHCEDLAQVLFRMPQEKYEGCDTVQLGQLLYRYTPQGLRTVQEFARRLLVNVLLGNGDAHLKNWSLRYLDRQNATLTPAYDLAFTHGLDMPERMLPIGGCSDWYALDFSHFAEWGRAVGVPWRVLRPTLLDTVERARTLWPPALEALPMAETDKLLLRHHWKSLNKKLQYGL